MMFERSSVTRIGSATFSSIEIEPIALAAHCDLGLAHALHLALELVRGAAQIGDVAQHGQHGVLRPDALAERMREHLEQQIVAFVRVDEIQLARAALLRRRVIAAFERNEVKSRLFNSTARRRPGESARRARAADARRARFCATMSFVGVRDDDRVGQRIDHQREPIALLRRDGRRVSRASSSDAMRAMHRAREQRSSSPARRSSRRLRVGPSISTTAAGARPSVALRPRRSRAGAAGTARAARRAPLRRIISGAPRKRGWASEARPLMHAGERRVARAAPLPSQIGHRARARR